MSKPTVAKELYRRLKEHGGWIASGELETWHVLDATGSTITRKLRLLEQSRFLEVKYEKGHAHYRALGTAAERQAYIPSDAPQSPLKASEKPAEPKMVQTVRYEMRDGVRVAVLERKPVYA
jgi:hypothetical protein